MHIYLIDKNINTVNVWSQYFSDNPDFTIFHGGFHFFMQTHKVDCIVSPANSYGLMDGGCGAVSPDSIAAMMYQAYKQVMNPPSEITWNYAERCYPEYYEDLFT